LPTGSGEASGDDTVNALTDASSAYNDILERVEGVVDLGNGGDSEELTLTPGLYKSDDSYNVNGDLTLSGAGVYIFQITGTLFVSQV
jgi:hypothetical protein